MNFTKTVAIGAFLASALVSTEALAKAHSQGRNQAGGMVTAPGENVQAETVAAARTLGERLGAARGFARLSGKKE